MKKITLLFILFCSLHLWAEPQNGVVYVVPGGTGTGVSWSDALGDIQTAINLAKSENPEARKDVWVAAGEYTISTCISVIDSVNVYGSFAGTESAVAERVKVDGGSAWDFVNPTVLKGNEARLFQVAAAADQETVIDGFVLMNGNAKGSVTDTNGGAVLLRPNVAVQNCIIKNNSATGAGGGIMMNGGGIIRYCLIKDNMQTTNANGGGGIYCNTSSYGFEGYIEHSEITGNSSTIRGAGMVVQGNTYTYVSNCKIYNNMAADGTTLKPGGAIFSNSANNRIINTLIYNNLGANAIYYNGGEFYNNVVVKNVGGLYTAGNTIKLINNIVWACATDATGTTATSITGAANAASTVHNNATYNPVPTDKSWNLSGNIQLSSNVSNGDVEEPAEGTIGSGPKFSKVSSFIGVGITEEELANLDSVNWKLNSSSPLINAGETVGYVTEDYTGIARPQGYPLEEAKMDIGAYELPYYTVVAGEGDEGNGTIYSSLGIPLTKDFTYGYAQGSSLELFFEANAGYEIGRAYYTISNDGGYTFTGEEVDFKNEIDQDGFWTVRVNNSFKITVDWHSLTALPSLDQELIQCFGVENGIRINGLKAGEHIRIYDMTGASVRNISAGSENILVPIRRGLYIVHLSEGVKKVVVK